MTARSYHHGGLRAAVLACAEGTLRRDGIEGLSLRELAREVGVSHAAPRRHFRDKAALLDALAAEGFARLDKCLATATKLDDRGFVSILTDVAVAYVRFATDDPALIDLMFTHKHRADASDELRQAANAGLGRLVALVEHGQSVGEVVDGEAESIALVLFATVHGIASLANNGMIDEGVLDEVTADAVGTLQGGLAPRIRPARTPSAAGAG